MGDETAEKAYTPTTDEIRDYVMVGGEPQPWLPPTPDIDATRAAAFDRWLAAHDAETLLALTESRARFGDMEQRALAAEAVIEKVSEARRENAFDGERFYSTWHIENALAESPSTVLPALKREWQAEAWNEGRDDERAARGVLRFPVNPYRNGGSHG